MKINYRDVVDFIEKQEDIQLYDCQKKALKAIIENNNVFIPRQVGMSTLLKGFGEYLIKISKSPESYDAGKYEAYEYDVIITLEELLSNSSEEQGLLNKEFLKRIQEQNKEQFKMEFDISDSFKV
jgi:hypothetical protein